LIHTLFENSHRLIREIATNFVIPKVLENVDLNIDENNFRNVNDINVGPECENFLQTLYL